MFYSLSTRCARGTGCRGSIPDASAHMELHTLVGQPVLGKELPSRQPPAARQFTETCVRQRAAPHLQRTGCTAVRFLLYYL